MRKSVIKTSVPAAVWGSWRELWCYPWQSRFVWPLLIINFLGSIYGYYWYHNQLAATPFYAWAFVPDSPLSTTLFALALAASLCGWPSPLLRVLACTVSIKYGIWAVLIISHFWWLGGLVTLTEAILWLSHLGMAAQGVIFLRPVYPGRAVVLATGGWMALNDLVDYVAGLHPYLFAPGQEPAAALAATTLTILLFILLYARYRLTVRQ